ncbi:kinase-like protein [Fomitiporia mediterranea MF3/22]|uniref:Mitogen-activated protein kinase n=1 Tax=Fomitiporia mediterranea (strain MF3/22) TaxID=694068 RepID=R7SF60_FOMME|nr:kinase-like protein [Fomitiporia mediterranea MF3/22]EJC97361.1 kinase-like protein [Fomitiporia mediterranea MF3/22]
MSSRRESGTSHHDHNYQYKIDESTRLGSGKYARVFKGKHVKTGNVVAIKRFFPITFDKVVFDREREINELLLYHPNIIMYLYSYWDPGTGHPCYVFELAEGGSVRTYLLTHEHYSEDDAMEIIKGTLTGLEYLHYKGIIHRDIKPANILLKRKSSRHHDTFKWDAALADFGIASELGSGETVEFLYAGTPKYFPPEAIVTGQVGKGGDLWATGIMMHIIFTGYVPWSQTKDEIAMMDEIKQMEFDFRKPQYRHISPNALHLMSNLLPKVEVRPSAHSALDQQVYQWYLTASKEKILNNREFCKWHTPDKTIKKKKNEGG